MEKYFKIGEISKLYNIGVDSLRYYEEIGLISPERSKSGYRLYSTHDIWKLNVIRELRELGFTMDRIKDYLSSHSTDATISLLEEEKKAVEQKLKELYELRKNVEKRVLNIQSAQSLSLNEISLKQYSDRACFATPQGYKEEFEMDVLIKKLLNLNKDKFYIIGSNQIGTIVSLHEMKNNQKLKYKSAFIIDENGAEILKGGKYLTVCYKGDYKKSAVWGQKLLDYCDNNGLTAAGDFLEILWIDIHTTENVDEHITELQLPVK